MNRLITRPVRSVAALTAALISLPTFAFATGPPSVNGVWQTDGYGLIIAIHNKKAILYDGTAISCLENRSADLVSSGAGGVATFKSGDIRFTLRPRDGLIKVDVAAGHYQARRLPRLPERCGAQRPEGPLATFDVFWTTFAENYPFFRAKGIDWQAVRAAYRPRVRPGMTDAELFELFTEMLEPLGDAHTGLTSGKRVFVGLRPGTTPPTRSLDAKVRAFIEKRDLGGRSLTSFANDHLQYADLPGRIGYLRINAFGDYDKADSGLAANVRALDQALDAILTRQRTSGPGRLAGLVIDLRVNIGGFDPLTLQLLSRLIDRPQLAYLKRARNDADDPERWTRPEAITVRPAAAPIYRGPIAVLTGGSTVSAGETFSQALMERTPRPVRIGQNTQGVFSDVMIRVLPNGWQFWLPNEEYRTPAWQTFDGPGVPVDFKVPVFTPAEFATNQDSAFDTALRLLGT